MLRVSVQVEVILNRTLIFDNSFSCSMHRLVSRVLYYTVEAALRSSSPLLAPWLKT